MAATRDTAALTTELVTCFGEERPGTDVAPATNIIELLGIPNRSLSLLRIRLAVQERLRLLLPADGLDGVTTIADLADALARAGRDTEPGEFETVTDPETLRELAENGIPVNQHLGITVAALYPEVRLTLPHRPTNLQHVGLLAIGGITAALEAAAGIAIALHVDPSTYPLITPALKLDVISALDHDMTAVSVLPLDKAAKLRAKVEKMGHAVFEHTSVGLNRDGKKAAKMTCTFYLRRVKDWQNPVK